MTNNISIYRWINKGNHTRFKMLLKDIKELNIKLSMNNRKNDIEALKDEINEVYGKGLNQVSFGYEVTNPKVLSFIDEVYKDTVCSNYFDKLNSALSVQYIASETNINRSYVSSLIRALKNDNRIVLHSIGVDYSTSSSGRKGVKFYATTSQLVYDNIYGSIEYYTIKPTK